MTFCLKKLTNSALVYSQILNFIMTSGQYFLGRVGVVFKALFHTSGTRASGVIQCNDASNKSEAAPQTARPSVKHEICARCTCGCSGEGGVSAPFIHRCESEHIIFTLQLCFIAKLSVKGPSYT